MPRKVASLTGWSKCAAIRSDADDAGRFTKQLL
jgi:hypothetical protein